MKSGPRIIVAVLVGALLGFAAHKLTEQKEALEIASKVVPGTEPGDQVVAMLQAPPDSPPQPPVKNPRPEPKEPNRRAPELKETPKPVPKEPMRKEPVQEKPVRKRVREEPVQKELVQEETVQKEPTREPPAPVPPPPPAVPVEIGTLSLNSSPWAHVTIDGEPMGRTPLTLKLPAGMHRVVLSSSVLPERTHEMQVEIQVGRTVKRTHYFKEP